MDPAGAHRPDVVEIFAVNWAEVGTKASLAVELAHITGIDERVPNGADASLRNVAERLSWAASRQTAKLKAPPTVCWASLVDPIRCGSRGREWRRI